MPSLRELQIGLVGAVLHPQRAGLYALHLHRCGLRNEQRIQIYRNNLQATLLAALEAVYPVVRKLVGEACFRNVALACIRSEVSRSGDIHDYGQRFPECLACLPDLAGHPYLPDVARLEWIYHSVFHSALEPGLQPGSLQTVPAARYADLRLQLQSASRLFDSPYPVLHIWQVNQEDWRGEDRVSLDEGGVRLLALRGTGGISFVPLDQAEFCLLQALGSGLTLGAACVRALEQEPDFDLPRVLARHTALGTFTGWQL